MPDGFEGSSRTTRKGGRREREQGRGASFIISSLAPFPPSLSLRPLRGGKKAISTRYPSSDFPLPPFALPSASVSMLLILGRGSMASGDGVRSERRTKEDRVKEGGRILEGGPMSASTQTESGAAAGMHPPSVVPSLPLWL